MEENHNIFLQVSNSPDTDSKLEPLKYKAGDLTLHCDAGSYSFTSCTFVTIVMGKINNLFIPILFYDISANYSNYSEIPT
jgi:hypothetical protein